MMKAADAFLATTSASYFAATVLPAQFEKTVSPVAQKIGYLAMGSLLAVLVLSGESKHSKVLAGVLGAAYGGLAIASYGGLQDWGGIGQNLFMSAWDLAVSVSCFLKVTKNG